MSKRHCALFALAIGVASCAREKTSEIWIGGDIHVGDRADGALDPLLPLFAGAPLVANLEGPVTTLSSDGKLSNAPAAVDAIAPPLVMAGIVNNHSLDFGRDEWMRSAERLSSIDVKAIENLSYRVIGDTRWVVTAHDLPAGAHDPMTLATDFRDAKLRARDGAWVATFHVTGPELYLPAPELTAAVDLAVLAGADVIAAHGTHVVGPFERRGNTVIAWGLGNLLFRCDCTKQSEGLLLHLTKRGKTIDAEVVPIEAGLGGAPARLAPDPEAQLDLLDAISPAPLIRSSLRDARTGRLRGYQAPEYQR